MKAELKRSAVFILGIFLLCFVYANNRRAGLWMGGFFALTSGLAYSKEINSIIKKYFG